MRVTFHFTSSVERNIEYQMNETKKRMIIILVTLFHEVQRYQQIQGFPP